MAGPRVAFHVGAHKTGTSLIQRYCQDNVAALRRHRVGYLGRSELRDLIGWGPRLVDDPTALQSRLRSMSRNPFVRTVLASHENTMGRPFAAKAGPQLYPRAPAYADALAGALAGAAAGSLPSGGTTVVLSVRPQAEFLESYYLHTVQIGGRQPFDRWLAEIDLEAISWRPLVGALDEAFGRENVRILDFRRIAHGQDAYLRSFFALVDPSLDLAISYPQTRNASISGKGLDLALAANPFLENGTERRAMRVFLQSHFSNRDHPRPVLLSDEQKAALHARYDAEYDELTARSSGART